jgi:hypothetical protein
LSIFQVYRQKRKNNKTQTLCILQQNVEENQDRKKEGRLRRFWLFVWRNASKDRKATGCFI